LASRQRTILAIPTDTHGGSPVGLIPSGQWQLVNGNYHNPSPTQTILWRLWQTAWEQVATLRRGARLIVVHLGDATEGKHHDSSELISPRVDEHERMHTSCMDWALNTAGYDAQAGDRLYYVKGTPAHVGSGGASEEKIARDLAAIPQIPPTQPEAFELDGDASPIKKRDGKFIWDHLKLSINGVVYDLAHHGASLGKKPWTRTNPLRSKLQEVYFRELEGGRVPPRYWIRAHMHQAAHDIYIGQRYTLDGYVTPAFQSKTEFGYKVAADMLASMGMIWFEIDVDGSVRPGREVIEYEPDPVMEV
jgi:hypothetical protein